jgi:hypothetical protein
MTISLTMPLDLDVIESAEKLRLKLDGKGGQNSRMLALIAELRATRAERDEVIRQHQQTLECGRKLLDDRDVALAKRAEINGPST